MPLYSLVFRLYYRPGKIVEALIKTTYIKGVTAVLENAQTGLKILEYFTPGDRQLLSFITTL